MPIASNDTAALDPRPFLPASITIVHADACHFCTDAGEKLDDLARHFPLDIRGVPADSDEGRALIAEYRPAMSPLVLLDGAFFSHGRLPRKKLTRLLEARSTHQVGVRRGD